jgi:hypothetical protein
MIAKTTTQTLEIVGDSIKMLRGEMSMKDFGAKYAGLSGGTSANLPPETVKNQMTMTGTDTRTGKPLTSTQYHELLKSGTIPELDKGKAKGKAKGGISSGPLSGYSETLHGTEAVVPLPDNRSIPVTLDSSSITNAMTTQIEHLARLITAMEKNNTLTSGILQNTY